MTNRSKFDGANIPAIEKRIEDGIVFEASSKISVANAGGIGEWLVRTGSKRVVIDARQITTNGNELDYQVFSGVTVSSVGTPVDVNSRNSKDSQETTVKVFHTPVVSGGTGVAPVYLPGSTASGQNTVGQFNQDGFVRILDANTDYIARVINNGEVTPANVELYLLFSEVTEPYPKS